MKKQTLSTVFENEAIGRNISMYRKIRGVKATEVAEKLGLKEAAYTRYERGEGAITIVMVKQVAEILKVDPLNLITTPPESFIDRNSIMEINAGKRQTAGDQHIQLMLKLMESVTSLNEKLIAHLNQSPT